MELCAHTLNKDWIRTVLYSTYYPGKNQLDKYNYVTPFLDAALTTLGHRPYLFASKPSALAFQCGVESNEHEANVSIEDVPWERCCEGGTKTQGEDLVSRCR